MMDEEIEVIPGQLRALLVGLRNSDAAGIFDSEELAIISRAAEAIEWLSKDNDDIHELAAHYREQLAQQKAAEGVH
jgi:hypothetical protein